MNNVSFDFVNSRVRFTNNSPLPVAAAAPSNQAFASSCAAPVAATPAAAAVLPPAQPPLASVTALLNRYPTITSSTATSWPTPTHTTSHHIQTMGPNDRLARDRRPVYKPTLAVNKLSV